MNNQYNDSIKDQGRAKLNQNISAQRQQRIKDFMNRFKHIPGYNAIHCKVTNLSSKQNQRSEIKKRLNLQKVLFSSKKQNKSSSYFGRIFLNTENRRILKDKINNKQVQNIFFNQSEDKYRNIKMNQKLKISLLIFKNEKIKLNKQRLSLKIKANNKILNPMVDCQKNIQRVTYTPFRNENQQLNLTTNKSKKTFHKSTSGSQQFFNVTDENRFSERYQNQSQTQLNKNKNGRQILQNLQSYKKEVKHKVTKQHMVIFLKNRAPIVVQNKKNTESNKQNVNIKKKKKLEYICNFIKTSDLQRQFRQNSLIKYKKVNQYDCKSLKTFENKSFNLINILHPEGQFSHEFSQQFNPW